MPDRLSIARQVAARLREFKPQAAASPAMVGFDGFVDSIIHVVDKRHGPGEFDRIHTLEAFGKRILASAGQSSNIELVTQVRKLGGNGPIMANALLSAGLPVTYIGALGDPDIDPVFKDFAERASVHSISNPGFTDALEFEDGKLMLGKLDAIETLDQNTIQERLGLDAYDGIILRSKLIAMVNWTMLPGMNQLWEHLATDVLPKLAGRRQVFIDLADPAKRTDEDIKSAMRLAGRLAEHAEVCLGFNLSEAGQVAKVMGIAPPENSPESLMQGTEELRKALGVQMVVVHPRSGAAASDGATQVHFAGPFVKDPKLSTGAGDNFNAGFCLGLLAGLGLEEALCCGTATSGYYVRNAYSPELDQLIAFCDDLPDPE